MDDLLVWLRAEIRKDIAGAEKLLEEGPERRWYDRYHSVYPRDLIARGTAELALLDEMIPTIEELDQIAMSEGLGSMAFGEPVALLLRLMVSGYQHRPGFDPSWLTLEAPVELPFDWARTEAEIADGRVIDPVWRDISIASAKTRQSLGLDATMTEARNIPHPFVKAEGDPYSQVEDVNLSQFCSACGAISPLMAHKESWPSRH